MAISIDPIFRAFYQGAPANGATCTVYQSGTTTPVTLYSDAALTSATTNPQVADANGEFYFYTANTVNLRYLVQTSGAITIRDIDPVYPAFIRARGTDIASASSVTLSNEGNYFHVTGTTGLSAISAKPAGYIITLEFDNALTLTHNASSFILQGAINFVTYAGFMMQMVSEGSGNWREICRSTSTIQGKGADIASATALILGNDGNYFHVTGTTTITSISARPAGTVITVEFDGALQVTYNSTTLILQGALNLNTTAGKMLQLVSEGGGNWRETFRSSFVVKGKGTDVISATTTDLSTATADFVDVTGTTTITGLGTALAGFEITVRFTGILILTYNVTSLILPSAANITTANGDTAIFRSLGAGNWKCINYTKQDGSPIIGIPPFIDSTAIIKGSGDPTRLLRIEVDAITTATTRVLTMPDQDIDLTPATQAQMKAGSSTGVFIPPGRQQFHPSACKVWVNFNGVNIAIRASYNVTSLTHNGVGDYTITFTTPFSSASYGVAGFGGRGVAADITTIVYSAGADPVAGSIRIHTHNDTGATVDPEFVCLVCFGDQ